MYVALVGWLLVGSSPPSRVEDALCCSPPDTEHVPIEVYERIKSLRRCGFLLMEACSICKVLWPEGRRGEEGHHQPQISSRNARSCSSSFCMCLHVYQHPTPAHPTHNPNDRFACIWSSRILHPVGGIKGMFLGITPTNTSRLVVRHCPRIPRHLLSPPHTHAHRQTHATKQANRNKCKRSFPTSGATPLRGKKNNKRIAQASWKRSRELHLRCCNF